MGKLTAQQQQQLADLEKIRDSGDDDDEVVVWVRNSDGHETRLSGERAVRWLHRNGYDVDDADDSSKGDPLDPKKSTPPAKKAAPKAGDADPPDDGAPLDQDPPAATARNPKKFF